MNMGDDNEDRFNDKEDSTVSDSGIGSTVFPMKRIPTLNSIASYVLGGRRQKSDDINIRKHSMQRFSISSTSEVVSMVSRRKSTAQKNQKNYDVRQQYYAGIGHSDLDIQTGRPPLMFNMNFLEWLWLQSGTSHRTILMGLGLLFGLALLQLIFGLYMIVSPYKGLNPYLCHTESCNYLSKRLQEKLNKSVNPCVNFYDFVCGSSEIEDTKEDREDTWNYGFDVGRVVYDFRYSSTLGRMLKMTLDKPGRLVLDMYRACLDHRIRNKLGLDPYYKVLKEFRLLDVSLQKSLRASDVVRGMSKILAHSFHTSAILKVQFYRQDANSPINAYIESALTEPWLAGSVFRYGYKNYHDTVLAVFTIMKDRLQITDQELQILPHDIVCMELFFRDTYTPQNMKYIIEHPENFGNKICEIGDNFTGTSIQANFGKAPNGQFDFDLLIRTMYSVSNPNWNPKAQKSPFNHDFNDPTTDPRTDSEFIERFKREFERSSPIRFIRYLQWRVLFTITEHLNDDISKSMLKVQRHRNFGIITDCFHALFNSLPFLAPHTYLKNSRTKTDSIIKEFNFTASLTIDIYNRRASHSIVKNMESVLNKTFTEREVHIINRMIHVGLRVDLVQPVEFFDQNFMSFRKLYTKVDFDYYNHLKNILKMGLRQHEWKTKPEYSDIFYKIDPKYRLPILFDRSRTNYDRVNNLYRIYLPMAVVESPFSQDGLKISDFGGLGLEFAGNLEKAFYMSLVFEESQKFLHLQFQTPEFKGKNPVTDTEIDYLEDMILNYHSILQKKFTKQIAEYRIGGVHWKKIRYGSAMEQILTTALADQSRYHAMSFVVSDYLSSPSTHWKEKKAVLYGLENYTPKQIFYIALVNRRCEKIGRNQMDQLLNYGPLPQSIKNNLALSNLDDFAESFNCREGSPMNRTDKVYFWSKQF